MESTYWIRYSDYEVVRDERNMECIKPKADAVPLAYDVNARLGDNLAELMNIVLDDSDMLGRSMRFVKTFGLLGLALEEDNYMTLPEEKADMNRAAFLITGRTGDKYAGVFSKEYSERSANISTWLDWLSVLYNRALISHNGRLVREPFVSITLQTMLESAFKSALSDKALKPCPICKNVFYSTDPAAECCSEECHRVYDNVKHLNWMKENFHSTPISGG